MPPWPMAMPSSTAIVLNSRGTAPAALTAAETIRPTGWRWVWPGTNSVKLLATATIGLPMSALATPEARISARAPAMLRPWVTVRDLNSGTVSTPLGSRGFTRVRTTGFTRVRTALRGAVLRGAGAVLRGAVVRFLRGAVVLLRVRSGFLVQIRSGRAYAGGPGSGQLVRDTGRLSQREARATSTAGSAAREQVRWQVRWQVGADVRGGQIALERRRDQPYQLLGRGGRHRLHLDDVPQHDDADQLRGGQLHPELGVGRVQLAGRPGQHRTADQAAEKGRRRVVGHRGPVDGQQRAAGLRVLPDGQHEAGQPLPHGVRVAGHRLRHVHGGLK